MKRRLALAIRPYSERLRDRIFELLRRRQVSIEAPAELDHRASNDEVVADLQRRRADLLLIPFHVVRTAAGDRTTGLELLARLRQSVPWTRKVPVVMPVSIFGGAAFEALWQVGAAPDVFPLREQDLDSEATLRAFDEFLDDPRRA